MAGNRRRGMVIQERDLRLMRELAITRVVDRELAKPIAGFQSTTRANTRLLALVRAGLLRRYVVGSAGFGQKYFYGLTPRGARVADVPLRGPQRSANHPLVADYFFEHQMAINEIYRQVKFPVRPLAGASFQQWRSFYKPLSTNSRLIPDGYFELIAPTKISAMFLEVDLGHESLKVWSEKVNSYVQLAASGDFEQMSGQKRFRVLVIVRTERRMQSLRQTTANVTKQLFWFATLEEVRREGLTGPIWLRPVGVERQPLIKELP